MGFTYADFRKQRSRKPTIERPVDRAGSKSSKEDKFLYSLHLKTIECRTLLATLKETMAPSEFDKFIVDYGIRLRKAKKNFQSNNFNDEWLIEGNEED